MGAGASTGASGELQNAMKTIGIVKSFMDKQEAMALGNIDDAKMEEFSKELGDSFAESVTCKVCDGVEVSVVGTWGEVMQTMGGYWKGINNTAVTRGAPSVTINDKGNTVIWPQIYTNTILNAANEPVADTEANVTVNHFISVNEDGKIDTWFQFLDTKAYADRKAKVAALDAAAAPAPAE